MGTWLERQIGILLAVIAVGWAVYFIVHAAHGFPAMVIKLGPMQLFMLGLLLWIHGKFRRSVDVNRA